MHLKLLQNPTRLSKFSISLSISKYDREVVQENSLLICEILQSTSGHNSPRAVTCDKGEVQPIHTDRRQGPL
ncbi:unnamed protein product [Tenebrio molitor]|nr:unnamed protein product [Tenebrio molitor]